MAFQSNPSNPSRRDNHGNSADVLVGKGGFIDDLIKFLEALGGNFTEFEIDRVTLDNPNNHDNPDNPNIHIYYNPDIKIDRV